MNRTVQLCESNPETIKNLANYKTECVKFVQHFMEGLMERYNWPYESIRVFNPRKGFKLHIGCGTWNALVPYTDGFWHFGLALNPDRHGRQMEQIRLLEFLLKKDSHYFILKVKGRKDEFRIHQNSKQQRESVYEFLLELTQRRGTQNRFKFSHCLNTDAQG